MFLLKNNKKMLDLLKDTRNSPLPLVQRCAKSGKTIPNRGGLKWPNLWLIVPKIKKYLKKVFKRPSFFFVEKLAYI